MPSTFRVDMEGSATTDVTLDILETMLGLGYRNVGTVVQAYLYRSEEDLRRLNRLETRVRLVKGAYKEPKRLAFQRKNEIDAAFVRLMKILLTEGTYPAIATHDPAMIAATQAFALERGIPASSYEFQMMYGIPPGSSVAPCNRRASLARLRSLRARMVPVLHAQAGRASGERTLRAARPARGRRPSRNGRIRIEEVRRRFCLPLQPSVAVLAGSDSDGRTCSLIVTAPPSR